MTIRIRKILPTTSEDPMGGGDWLTKALREERQGTRADEPRAIQKRLEADVENGRVSLTKAEVLQFAKTRAREIWLARGAVRGSEAGILDEVLSAPLSGLGDPSPDDPPLATIYKAAPESAGQVTKRLEREGEATMALQAFDRYVEQVQKANPALTRPAAVSKALADETGVQLYKRYVLANQRLDRIRGAR